MVGSGPGLLGPTPVVGPPYFRHWRGNVTPSLRTAMESELVDLEGREGTDPGPHCADEFIVAVSEKCL